VPESGSSIFLVASPILDLDLSLARIPRNYETICDSQEK
jgi:hypothetical protein